jgi:2,4'-dihydroxyacetophenone dioxygenase
MFPYTRCHRKIVTTAIPDDERISVPQASDVWFRPSCSTLSSGLVQPPSGSTRWHPQPSQDHVLTVPENVDEMTTYFDISGCMYYVDEDGNHTRLTRVRSTTGRLDWARILCGRRRSSGPGRCPRHQTASIPMLARASRGAPPFPFSIPSMKRMATASQRHRIAFFGVATETCNSGEQTCDVRVEWN